MYSKLDGITLSKQTFKKLSELHMIIVTEHKFNKISQVGTIDTHVTAAKAITEVQQY